MSYDAATISAGIAQIKRITGLDVRHDATTGNWEVVHGGNATPVKPENAATFDTILADVAAARAAKPPRTSTPRPTSQPAPPNPASAPSTPSSAPAAPPTAPVDLITSGRFAGMTKADAAAMRAQHQMNRDWDAALAEQARRNAPPKPPTPPKPPSVVTSGRYAGMTQADADALRAQQQVQRDWDAAIQENQARAAADAPEPPPTQQNWWQRMTATPQARAILRPVRRYIGGLAAVGTLNNVREAGEGVGQGSQAVVEGAGSITGSAFQTGTRIGQSILDGAMRPFGASGAAVSRFAGVIAQTMQGALGAGIGLLGKSAGVLGRMAGTGIGFATAGLGAAAGGALGLGVGAAPGWLIGAAVGSLVGVAIAKVAASVGDMISSVLGAAGHALGAVGDLATGAFRATLDVLEDVTKSVTTLARAALDLSQKSGLSLASSANANNLLAGFGVKGSDVEGLSRNTLIGSAYSRAMGLQGEQGSEQWLRSFRQQYQSSAATGPQGLLQAQVRARAGGLESLIPLANLPSAQFEKQIQRSNAMQSALGMSPQQIAQFGQGLTGVQAQFSQFVELAKAKFGSELLPYIQGAMDKLVGYIASHGKQISAAFVSMGQSIVGAARWAFTQLPDLALRGASMVLHGVASMVRGAAGFVRAWSEGETPLQNFFSKLLGAIDKSVLAFRLLGAAAAGILTGILVGNIAAAAGVAAAWASGGLAAIPAALLAAGGAAAAIAASNFLPIVAGGAAALGTFAASGALQTDLQGDFNRATSLPSGPGIASRMDGMAGTIDSYGDWTDKKRKDFDPKDLAANFDGLTGALQENTATLKGGLAVSGELDLTNAQQKLATETVQMMLTGRRLARSRG